MSNAILSDLTLRISTSTAELSQGLKSAGDSINRFSKKAKEQGEKVKAGFTSMKDGVKSMASSLTSGLSSATGGLSDLAGGIPSVIAGIRGMTAGMNILKVAIAGTGIGLLVVALASLIAYFTKTQEGAEFISQAMAAIGAVVTVLIDTLSGFGKLIVGVFSDPVASAQKLGNIIKDFVLSRVELLMGGLKGLGKAFKLLFAGEFSKAAKQAGDSLKDIARATSPVAWALEGTKAALDGVIAKYGEASDKAQKAMQLQRDTNNLERERVTYMEKAASIEEQISKAKLEAKNKDNSEAERLDYLQQAQRLQKELSAQQVSFAERELKIKRETDALGNNMLEDDRKTAELAVQVLKLKADENNKLKELVSQENRVKTEIAARGKEHAKLVEQRAKELELARLQAEVEVMPKVKSIGIDPKTFSLPPISLDIEVKPVDMQPAISSFQMGLMVMKDQAASLSETFSSIGGQISQATGAISGAFSAVMENRTIELDNYYATELASIENSRMTEEQKAAAIMNLDREVGEEKRKLAIKQAKMQKATALLAAIVNTAQGVTQAIAQGGIAGIVTGAIVAAAGAIQIGAIASQPIPAFANGGRVQQSGLTLVGERGPELLNLPSGANVTRANKTEQLLGQAQKFIVNIAGRISGQDIVLAVEETQRRNGINF